MAVKLTYQDYYNSLPQGSEAGGNGAVDENTWNQWTNAQKGQNLYQQATAINPWDPRYAELQRTTGGSGKDAIMVAGGPFQTHGSTARDNGMQIYNDPSKVYQGDGVRAFLGSNLTPEITAAGDDGLSDKQWGLLAATLFGGAALAGGALGGAASAGPMSTSVGGGFGTGALGSGGTGAAFSGAGGAYGAAGAGLGSGSGASGLNFEPMQPLQPTNVGNLGPDFQANSGLLGGGSTPSGGFNGLGEGGLDPNTLGGQGGMGVGQNGIGPGSYGDILQGTMNNPSSLIARGGDLAGQAGQWAINNPLRAYSLANGVAGMFQGNGSTGSPSGGSSKASAGQGVDPSKLARPQWQQNPYIAAQLHAGGYQ